MKKITSLLMILFSILGFSQDNRGKIQTYLNENRAKLNLTTQDINDWFVESTGNSESTKIDTYWIKQRYQGIEIHNAVSNVWIKNDEVINVLNGFVPNISSKVNTTTPNLSVLDALKKGFISVNATNINAQIIETISNHEFKISNGNLNEDPTTAKLVFQPVGESLKLAWDFNFYTQDHNHLWSIRIDALNGTLLEKNDMVISCDFGKHSSSLNNQTKNNFSFYRNAFKDQSTSSVAQVQGGSYRVVPFNYDSPDHHSRDLITNPENATASPKGWHDTNTLTGTLATLKYTYLRGNNVWARADYGNTNPTTHSTTSTANGYSPTNAGLTFDYSYPGTSAAANTYIDAATTNLFYMNNVLHDIWYQYGFNEPNGNFQQTNYVSGGSGSDHVWADAQDGSSAATPTLNNANFSTPVDGSKPRMQMYLWSYRKITQLLTVNSPSDIAGGKYTSDNGFNPGHVNVPTAPAMIQSDIVLFDDGTPDIGQTDNADGCSAAVNAAAINGHIAIIRRSTSTANGGNPCSFIQKALNAKAAGATALIIVNNDDTAPNSSIGMSGADANVTIPVISLSLNNGEAIITKLKNGEIVNAKIQSPSQLDLFVNTDGDLDNGVIAHEFGHGISTRLAGGRSNSSCLQNEEQMGEGWSDWFALMLSLKPGDVGTNAKGMATFVMNESPSGYGLRNYPYSTDMSINPETFDYVNYNQYDSDGDGIPDTTETHNVGEVWATMLWDLTWSYINKYGYDDNKYTGTGGNNKVMRLILDAIKLEPCSPTFVEARNAILAADLATTNGQDYCMIWEVFARRGLGLNADSGSRNSSIDEIEDFTVPTPGATPATGSNCTLSVNYFETQDLFRVYPNPTNGLLNIRINNYVGKVNIQVIDINGRIVNEFKNEDFNIEKSLNLSNLQTGMYVLKVNGDSLNFTQKIMKN
jgi:hypothetical protein